MIGKGCRGHHSMEFDRPDVETTLAGDSRTSPVAAAVGSGTNLDLTVDSFTSDQSNGALRLNVSLP
ncbi:MAG: hypothetical protein KJ626_05675 [Verrucomicrobia bacterium]|nr:hypothetical protein [Verrucomicrobiota bacterium]